MAQVLSQDEIDALLSNVQEGESKSDKGPSPQLRDGQQAVLYDFRHPNRVSKDQVRSLESLHGNFASLFGSALSGFTRSVVDVDLISVDQITYAEFIMSLSTPSCTYVFSLDPLDGAGILDFNPSVAFAFVDRMFGGRGKAISSERELSGIEKSVMGKIMDRAFQALGNAWEHIEKINIHQSAFESNPQFIQIVAPGETVIVVSLQIKMLSASGLMTVCYPYLALEQLMDKLSAQNWIELGQKGDKKSQVESNARELLSVGAEVKVTLGGTDLTIKDLLDLKPGDVVRLDALENDDINVFVGDKEKFYAKPGHAGNVMAVRITKPI